MTAAVRRLALFAACCEFAHGNARCAFCCGNAVIRAGKQGIVTFFSVSTSPLLTSISVLAFLCLTRTAFRCVLRSFLLQRGTEW